MISPWAILYIYNFFFFCNPLTGIACEPVHFFGFPNWGSLAAWSVADFPKTMKNELGNNVRRLTISRFGSVMPSGWQTCPSTPNHGLDFFVGYVILISWVNHFYLIIKNKTHTHTNLFLVTRFTLVFEPNSNFYCRKRVRWCSASDYRSGFPTQPSGFNPRLRHVQRGYACISLVLVPRLPRGMWYRGAVYVHIHLSSCTDVKGPGWQSESLGVQKQTDGAGMHKRPENGIWLPTGRQLE